MVTVTVSETYDLCTKPNKMSLLGIKTPPVAFIRKMYPGFFMNFKMMKIEKCDIAMSCASVLPADPQQIGTETGSIAPADMMNPILYKAVSNESMSTIEARLAGLIGTQSFQGQSVIGTVDGVTPDADEFPAYYGLLSNRDGWRVAVPQQGLSMTNLVPLCFEQLYNYAWNGPDAPRDQDQIHTISDTGTVEFKSLLHPIRGNSKPLPAFATSVLTGRLDTNQKPIVAAPGFVNDDISRDGSPGQIPANAFTQVPDIGPFYVACIVMPPSKLQVLYYRLVVRWTCSFYGPRQISEITSIPGLATTGSNTFFSNYTFGQSLGTKEVSDQAMVTTADAGIQKIMEGS